VAIDMATIVDVGIPIDLSKGTFNNVEYANGKLQLAEKDENETLPNGKKIYCEFGFWESEVIDLVDAFKDFDRIAVNMTNYTKDKITIYTRTSSNGFTWTSYVPINSDNTIASPIGRYIQIKVSFTAGMTDEVITVDDFNSGDEVKFEQNDFVQFDGKLSLKKEYEYTMTKDNSWNEEGSLFRQMIPKSKLKKIDEISMISEVN
jgi:hypothetical protein